LVGFAMRAQVAVLAPGINPFSLVTTNAVEVTVARSSCLVSPKPRAASIWPHASA